MKKMKNITALFLSALVIINLEVPALASWTNEEEKTEFPSYFKELSELVQNTSEENNFGSILLTVGETEFNIDGETKELSEAPSLEDGELIIPEEVIYEVSDAPILGADSVDEDNGFTEAEAEKLGYKVTYFEEEGKALITEPYQLKRLMVKTKDGKVKNTYGATSVINVSNNKTVLQYDSKEETKYAAQQFKKDSSVIYCAQDSILSLSEYETTKTSAQSAEEREYLSWGTTKVGADYYMSTLPDADELPEIVVAVIDTGVEMDHPFLDGRIKEGGYDFFEGDDDPTDELRHGTLVSGVIVDATKSNVKILPLRVGGISGLVELFLAIEAVSYAADSGADIINMSFGGMYDEWLYPVWQDAIKYATDKDVVCFSSSGNEGIDIDYLLSKDKYMLPGLIPEVINVGATVPGDNIVGFSNYGSSVDLAAPGTSITSSSLDGQYETVMGTSFSSPTAAACAALLLSSNPDMTYTEVTEELCKRALDRGQPGKDASFGYGRVHLGKEPEPIEKISFFANESVAPFSKSDLESEKSTNTTNSNRFMIPMLNFYPFNAQDCSVTYTSSNPEVLTINGTSEYFISHSYGTAVLTAETTVGNLRADVRIRVVSDDDYETLDTEITLSEESIELRTGESFTLTVPGFDKSFGWRTSNSEVAYVDGSGNVTAMNEGEAKIVAYDFIGGIANSTATCIVNVTNPEVDSIKINSLPQKTCCVGDVVNAEGLSLSVTYSDGSTGIIAGGFSCSPKIFTEAGKQTVTVTHLGASCTFDVVVEEVYMTDVEIVTLPEKLEYFEKETLDTTGLSIRVTYNNGKEKIITDGFTCSPAELNTPGKQTVTVSYNGMSCTFDVTVKAVLPTEIEILTQPEKLEYYVGDTLDTTGLSARVLFNNGVEEIFTDGLVCTPMKLDSKGEQVITVSYGEVSDTFEVWVTPGALVGLKIKSLPNKLSYYYEDTLDLDGLELVAVYENGTMDVTEEFTVTPTELNTRGEQTVTINYKDFSASFKVMVSPGPLRKIEVNTLPEKLNYYVGDTLDTDGLTINAVYDFFKLEMTENFTVTPTKLNTAGKQKITVSFLDASCEFEVMVAPGEIKGIEVKSMPKKTSYFVGDVPNIDGLVLTAVYEYGTLEITDGFTAKHIPFDKAGTGTVMVEYSGKTCTFDVTVKEVLPVGIKVNSLPTDTEYCVGEYLDTAGMSVTIIYNNGTEKVITSGFYCSPTMFNMTGTQIITVVYSDFVCTFEVFVEGIKPISIEIKTLPNKVEYLVGESLDTAGMSLYVTYNNRTKKVITEGFTYDDKKFTTAGRYSINVYYSGLECSFEVQATTPQASVRIYSNDGEFSQKIDWWKRYSTATMELGFRAYNCGTGAKYVWSSSNNKVKIDQHGHITNTGLFSRSSTITLTVYDLNGDVIAKNSVKVKFYKFSLFSN